MPNMGALAGRSVTAVSFGRGTSPGRKKYVLSLLNTVGGVIEVEERHMHTVTAVSGSGPAYFFLMAEELRRAGVESGLSEDAARYLSELTLDSAAGVLMDPDMTAGKLIEKVASKGGTTEAALKVFRAKGFSSIVSEAVEQARKRSEQLEGGK
jgi:pyrroline-5-carboxylate reductase